MVEVKNKEWDKHYFLSNTLFFVRVCVAGLVQPVEDRPGDGQDDNA